MQSIISPLVSPKRIFRHFFLSTVKNSINLPFAVVTNNVVIISSAFNSCATKVFRLVPDYLKY